MSNENNIEKVIHEYIMKYVSVDKIEYDQDIFESGLVNSLFTIELMTFLEKTFNIKITMDDLDMKNFVTISCIGQFVRNKR